jgi:NAD(P)-dependent dehydrogenase (short-subunit alcohol dehydrogenase family)
MGRLQGRTAVISGAASGIGRATAKLFALEGANVVATDRSAAVEETVREIHAAGGQAVALQGDAGAEDDVMSWMDRAVSEYGQLDVVYANAGISGAGIGYRPFFELTPEDWEMILRVNLIGPFLAIKHAAPIMQKQGKGSIICTASVAGLRSGAGPTPYSASKAGVINLVQTACQELYGSNIRVNAICPGLIETGMTKPLFDRAREKGSDDKIGQLNPLKRYGVPTEIANTALFLASDDSSYVNGQAFVVDGGLSSSHPVPPRRAGAPNAF